MVDLTHVWEVPSLRRTVDIDVFLYRNNICCRNGEVHIEEARVIRDIGKRHEERLRRFRLKYVYRTS